MGTTRRDSPGALYESGTGRRAHTGLIHGIGPGPELDKEYVTCEECGKEFKKRGIKIHLSKNKVCKKKAEERKQLEMSIKEKKQQEETPISHCSSEEQKSAGDPLPGTQPLSRGSPVRMVEEKATEIISPSVKKSEKSQKEQPQIKVK